MTRAKTQSTPSSEKPENIFLCALGVLARENFLKWFCQTFQKEEFKSDTHRRPLSTQELPGLSLFFLGRLDLIEISQRVVADGHHLIVAGKAWLGGGLGPRAQKDHVLVAGVVELIELAGGNRHQHAGIESPRRAVGEMKCALSFNAVELLVGGVLVHRAPWFRDNRHEPRCENDPR